MTVQATSAPDTTPPDHGPPPPSSATWGGHNKTASNPKGAGRPPNGKAPPKPPPKAAPRPKALEDETEEVDVDADALNALAHAATVLYASPFAAGEKLMGWRGCALSEQELGNTHAGFTAYAHIRKKALTTGKGPEILLGLCLLAPLITRLTIALLPEPAVRPVEKTDHS